MSGKVLFACSKCFSRHPFEELSAGQQLCKNCRGSSSVGKCTYCRSEFQAESKSQNACKKCMQYLSKYGKPSACECCRIVAAFGKSKCMRCANYEEKYGPPVQCDECKQRSAFDRHDENKKVNGKLLCWLCTNAYKRAFLKAQQEGRIAAKKRPYEKTRRDNASSGSARKTARTSSVDVKSNNASASLSVGLDLPEKLARSGSGGSGGGNGNGSFAVSAAPVAVSIDPNSSDHVVAMTNLKEKIVSCEKRLNMKDKELLEKDKLITELKGKNFEKEIELRNKIKEIERIHDMKTENLNRKITSLLRELAAEKRSNKKNGAKDKLLEREKRENLSPKSANLSPKSENVSPKEEFMSNSPDIKEDVMEETKAQEEPADAEPEVEEKSQDAADVALLEDKREDSNSSRSSSNSSSSSRSRSRSRSNSRSRSRSRSATHSRSNSPSTN